MSRRAIIAGAGIGGLATALALSRAGFDITVYERSEGLEEFGAGLQLTPNANRVLSRLEVLENVLALATRPSAVCAFRGSDDFALTRMPVADAEQRWGAPYLAIHRADLQRVLAEAVRRRPNVDLRFGTTVGDVALHTDRISYWRDARFSDNSRQRRSLSRCRWSAFASARTFRVGRGG